MINLNSLYLIVNLNFIRLYTKTLVNENHILDTDSNAKMQCNDQYDWFVLNFVHMLLNQLINCCLECHNSSVLFRIIDVLLKVDINPTHKLTSVNLISIDSCCLHIDNLSLYFQCQRGT